MINDNTLDGTKIQNKWFPDVEADVFISHSHDDYEKAVGFAGYLRKTFGLEVFIDSCVWWHKDELQEKIDDKYCKNLEENSYSYKRRNYSTAHVNMMLSTALSKMIDRCECIIFLSSENSVVRSEISTSKFVPQKDNEKTKSPWIYSELETTRIIRRKSRYGVLTESVIEKKAEFSDKFYIHYDINLNHLYKIDNATLNEWENCKSKETYENLDILYRMCK